LAEDGIRDFHVTGVQTCALPISMKTPGSRFLPWLGTRSQLGFVSGAPSSSAMESIRACRRCGEVKGGKPSPQEQAGTEKGELRRSEERRVGDARRTRKTLLPATW